MKQVWTWGIFSFAFLCLTAVPANSVVIHDAAFSPEGKTIGIATDLGLQLRDSFTKWVYYSYSVPGGVKFMK